MNTVAAIDIGTNTVLLLIAEREGGQLRALCERATITRLGQGVDASGKLAPAAMERTLACLADYVVDIARHRVDRVAAVGTSALRLAAGSDFVDRAERILGARPEVVSGQREAELTFAGALCGIEIAGDVGVFDIGGGSTEVIAGAAPARIDAAVSLEIGSVRLTERHIQRDPPTAAELEAVRADVRDALRQAPDLRGRALVGVAGTVTTLAAFVHGIAPYDGGKVHGASLSRSQLAAALRDLAAMSVAERKRIAAIEPQRADVIVAGAVIAEAICAAAGAERVIVSDRGVRWGLALSLV